MRINERGIVSAYPLGLEGTGDETSWEGAPYAVDGVDDVRFLFLGAYRTRAERNFRLTSPSASSRRCRRF